MQTLNLICFGDTLSPKSSSEPFFWRSAPSPCSDSPYRSPLCGFYAFIPITSNTHTCEINHCRQIKIVILFCIFNLCQAFISTKDLFLKIKYSMWIIWMGTWWVVNVFNFLRIHLKLLVLKNCIGLIFCFLFFPVDIKPENLLISSDDVLKLCDFGKFCFSYKSTEARLIYKNTLQYTVCTAVYPYPDP